MWQLAAVWTTTVAGIRCFFKPAPSEFPSSSETEIENGTTKEVNVGVKEVLQQQASQGKYVEGTHWLLGWAEPRLANLRLETSTPQLWEGFIKWYLTPERVPCMFLSKSTLMLWRSVALTKMTTLPSQKREVFYTGSTRCRKAGTTINTAIILTAAQGIVVSRDRILLAKDGGSINLTKSWACILGAQNGHSEAKGVN